MCGRYTLFTDFESLIDRFDIEYSMEEDLFMPSYNIAPSQEVVSIINQKKMLAPSFALKSSQIQPIKNKTTTSHS
ncbi:SOS response-associated peptidase family protein [Psychrobacillus sp. FJAT-51614]|uniref:SOS response-associated peptidase family protein n=1 Tax=Psychrobacillus mangrovi TaxID=3117745 RepID=A0ABU8FAG5_9BACI